MNLYAYVGNDPLNATDPTGLKVLVRLEGYRLRNLGPNGHAWLVLTDTETSQSIGMRAGPNPPYAGGLSSGVNVGVEIGGVLDLAGESYLDSSVGSEVLGAEQIDAIKNGSSIYSIESTIVDIDFDEARAALEALSAEIDGANILYKPRSQNSSSVAGTGYRVLTGREPGRRGETPTGDDEISFPGIRNDLRRETRRDQ